MSRNRKRHTDRCAIPNCQTDPDKPLVGGLCFPHRIATMNPNGNRTRVAERQLGTWRRQWTQIAATAQHIADLAETIIAASFYPDPDAYPKSVRGQEGHGDGDHADPTLAHIEHAAGGIDDENQPEANTPDHWQPPTDAVIEWVGELRHLGAEAAGLMRRAGRLSDMVANRRDLRVTDTGGYCKACGRHCSGAEGDRLRSLYCWACYQAWRRWSATRTEQGQDAPHHLFEEWRRNNLDQASA